MRAHLLDTDVLIDFLRGRRAARALVESFESAGEVPLISIVSVAELIAGMKAGEEEATMRFLAILGKIPIAEEVAFTAGRLLSTFQQGHRLELGDALIAATAIEYDATLVTRNVKHYPMSEINLLRPY